MVLKVIIDTNFLLIPGRFGVDIFQEIIENANDKVEFVIFQNVVSELEKLAVSIDLNTKEKAAAKLGLQLLKQKNLKIEQGSNEHTDDVLLHKALEYQKQGFNSAIATVDKELISKATNRNVWVFALRQKKKVLLLK